MKTKILPLVLTIGSLSASTYYITVDKEFKPYYNTAFKWVNGESSFTEWVDKGVPFDYTQFLPEITNQISDFQQTREYKVNQERYEQPREKDEAKDIYKDVGEPSNLFIVFFLVISFLLFTFKRISLWMNTFLLVKLQNLLVFHFQLCIVGKNLANYAQHLELSVNIGVILFKKYLN